MYLVVFYVGEYVWVCGCVGVYTKSKSSELSPLRQKLLRNFLLRCARKIYIQIFKVDFWPVLKILNIIWLADCSMI
jgi:hypothetical protein